MDEYVKHGSESQDFDDPAPPGTDKTELDVHMSGSGPSAVTQTSARGVENARRVLRAFAIQKKPMAAPAVVTNIKLGVGALPSTTAVVIGKLPIVKPVLKIEKHPNVYVEKMEKPPKPGDLRKAALENYEELQRKTLLEIEHMKRKQEMVDLGIPLGLLCPEHSKKAVPTKAMPPIKTFLDNEKVDEIIAEAKKAKAEGKEFKFDYSKFVPDYENPFQRKMFGNKEDSLLVDCDRRLEDIRKRKFTKDMGRLTGYSRFERNREERERKRENRRRDKYERAKSRDNSKDDKHRDKKSIDKDNKSIDKDKKHPNSDKTKILSKDDEKAAEAKVNLNDYLVCDSWSLDNDERSTSSPQVDKKPPKGKLSSPAETKNTPTKNVASPMDQVRANLAKFSPCDVKNIPTPQSQMSPAEKVNASNKGDLSPMELLRANLAKNKVDSPKKFVMKIEKLKPVIDSFKFEIDDDEDEVLDIFDERSDINKFAKPTIKKESEVEEKFLESVINEIGETDKGLVAYESPKETMTQGSATPDMDDSYSVISVKSDNSDGWRSTESRKSTDSFKSSDTGYKSSETVKIKDTETSAEKVQKSQETTSKKITEKSGRKDKNQRERSLTVEKDLDMTLATEMSTSTVDSLETWSFVLKICQPILFRHDRNKCYKETRAQPKLWYTENPKVCNCVQDRAIVYEELEMCKSNLIDRVYGCTSCDYPAVTSRTWYPNEDGSLMETLPASSQPDIPVSNEWETSDKDSTKACTPEQEISLDNEYEKFMQAVLPEVADVSTCSNKPSRSTTPQRQERKKKMSEDIQDHKKGGKKIKLSSNQDWSMESEPEEAADKGIANSKKRKKKESNSNPSKDKAKVRKRKLSTSTFAPSLSTVPSDDDGRKRKKIDKKTIVKKSKQDKAKRRRLEKKITKKLDGKKKKKLKDVAKEESVLEDSLEKAAIVVEAEVTEPTKDAQVPDTKKKVKKIKKKVLKVKKKSEKKKKRSRSSSSSDSSSSDDSSDDKKKKKKKNNDSKKKKKTKKKKKKRRQSSTSDSQSEELFDVNILNNIKTERVDAAPQGPARAHREIINVTSLQDDFTTQKVKQEKEEEERREQQMAEQRTEAQIQSQVSNDTTGRTESQTHVEETKREDIENKMEEIEIVNERGSEKDVQSDFGENMDIEPAESQEYKSISAIDASVRERDRTPPEGDNNTSHSYSFNDYTKQSEYEDNYEMYEQMAMEYQSDVAKQIAPSDSTETPVQRIETVVQLHSRGEIKCDWRATDGREPGPVSTARPSRWGLKPSDVNIVLTGDDQTVYRIQSLANSRTESTGYDEAYKDMYGASDRLQYGDCFDSSNQCSDSTNVKQRPSLDSRINTVLAEATDDSVKSTKTGQAVKRVSFADGYKPGQDSDVEEPPVKKRKKPRRTGCAWPCPAEHPDHVSLWDALPPPPPPPGSPPPAVAMGPPVHLLRQHQYQYSGIGAMQGSMSGPMQSKDQPHPMMNFMPPEPPPGHISFT